MATVLCRHRDNPGICWAANVWSRASELRGQPYLSFLPHHPFAQILDDLRPRPISDSELGSGDADSDLTVLWPMMPATWLQDDEEYITGLNSLIEITLVWENVKTDMIHKAPADTLRQGMARIQAVLDNLPPELRWTGGVVRFPPPSMGHRAQTVNILITCFYLRSNLIQNLGKVPGITHQRIVK